MDHTKTKEIITTSAPSAAEMGLAMNFMKTYIECVENMPDDVQRQLSILRECDVKCQSLRTEIEHHADVLQSDSIDPALLKKTVNRMKTCLIACQQLGDEKLELVQLVHDLIETRHRQLEVDARALDAGKEHENNDSGRDAMSSGASSGTERQSKRARRTRIDNSLPMDHYALAHETGFVASQRLSIMPQNNQQQQNQKKAVGTAAGASGASGMKKKQKRKGGNAGRQSEREREDSPPDIPIDPDEPTYCLCDQVSFGEMIGCDNDLCPIEWFHFSCVNLTTKPKGKWFCPKCRGDRPNVMKPKSQFLRELEKFNRDKEDRA